MQALGLHYRPVSHRRMWLANSIPFLKEETHPRKAICLMQTSHIVDELSALMGACGNILALALCGPKMGLVLSSWEQMLGQDC